MAWFVNAKRRGLNLLYCFLGTILGLTCLSLYSEKADHSANGFIRLLPPHVANPKRIRDLHGNTFYLVGATPSHFYLGNNAAPQLITTIDPALADTSVHWLSMASAGGRFARGLMTAVDSPNIYLFDGITPSVTQGTTTDTLLHRAPAKFYFNLATPLSPVSRIFRAVDGRRQNVLAKQLNDSIIRADAVLEKQVDGIFDTQGALLAQPGANRLVYVYNYRNQFIVMDTNLQVRFKARTIDTVSRVKFSVGYVPSDRSLTLSSPPQFVNLQSCVDGNYLFIHSALRADNDVPTMFEQGSAIDVYSLIDGKYIFSFFLPDYAHQKVRDFRVAGNTLIALYGQYAYGYKLQIPTKLQQ